MKNRLLSIVFLLFATNAIAQVLPPMGSGGAASGGGDALTANPLSQFAPTTSAQLLATITNATGTGAAVFGTAPTFTTNLTVPVIKSATTLAIQTNGATQAVLFGTDQSATFAGNVGVGITPTEKLHIAGSAASLGHVAALVNNSSSSGLSLFRLTNDQNKEGFFGAQGSAVTYYGGVTGGAVVMGSGDSVPVHIINNDAVRITISTLGGVTLIPMANTSVLASSTYSVTSTGTTSLMNLAGTLNGTGIVDVLKLSVTNTATNAASKLLNLYAGASGTTSVFSVSLTGNVVIDGSGGFYFDSGLTTGLSKYAASVVGLGGNLLNAPALYAASSDVVFTSRIGWTSGGAPSVSSGSITSYDTAFSRISAGLIGAGTGAAASFAGGLKLTNLIIGVGGSVDLSAIAAGSPNLVVTKTTDTPTTTWTAGATATNPAGYIEITEGGTSKYIPFYQ